MRLLHGLDGLRDLPTGAAVTIGNFDGVHLGHRHLIRAAAALRDAGRASAVAAVTFEPHPLTVLRPEAAPPRLTPVGLKRSLLAAAGIEHLVELPPTRDVLDLSAERFWEILRDEVRPAHLIEGASFRFGKGAAGTVAKLAQWTRGTDVGLHIVDAVEVALLDLQVVPVTSSTVRFLLGNGRVRDAAICLGRAYALEGPVVKGFQRGRTIGVPTANLKIDDQLLPLDGVYAGRCAVDDGAPYAAAVSVGTMPTFGENVRQVEAHLLGFSGNLYDRAMRVELVDWIRAQWKFNGVEPLKARIARDVREIVAREGLDPARGIAAVTG